ncbi:F-box domain-containing protein [Mycena chlorophos]|uniref:F-box domain-containing protein n=1 Tax=Mycena chlorophos TaxID=658473 RepID=A0A8H6VZF5_MYCCL|nr:F-box domain-containing protein [Mycena chlorophos]
MHSLQPNLAFDTLPVEIVAAIFLECIPWQYYNKPHPESPPLVFTRVSQRWRAIAFETTELWRSFKWDLRPWVLESARRIELEEGLNSWISRAANRSLGIRLYVSALPSSFVEPDGRDATLPLSILAALHRAHTLSLELPPWLFEIWNPQGQSLPSLRSLSAKLDNKSLSSILQACQNVLSTLHLLPAPLSFPELFTVPIAAPSLRWLEIEPHISVLDLLRTMRDCPRIVHLFCLQVSDFAGMRSQLEHAHHELRALHLPNLEFLRLDIDCYHGSDGSNNFFRYLGSTPNLSALDIQVEDSGRDNLASNLCNLLERSRSAGAWATRLRYLHYDYGYLPLDLEFLNHLTVLEVLDVDLRYEAKLRTKTDASIDDDLRHGFDTTVVLELLNASEQLQTLWILFFGVLLEEASPEPWQPRPTFLEHLRPFVQNGLDFVIVAENLKVHKAIFSRDPDSHDPTTNGKLFDGSAEDFRAFCWAMYAPPYEIHRQTSPTHGYANVPRLLRVAHVATRHGLHRLRPRALDVFGLCLDQHVDGKQSNFMPQLLVVISNHANSEKRQDVVRRIWKKHDMEFRAAHLEEARHGVCYAVLQAERDSEGWWSQSEEDESFESVSSEMTEEGWEDL